MTHSIHPTALVDDSAQLGDGVEIGPFCIVGPNVKIGDRTRLISHVTLSGQTDLGADCVLHPFVSLGEPPQDFKFKGGDVRLIVGDRNILREQVTMHMGTETAKGVTEVGSDNFFMVGAHVAHDCKVGNHVVFANNATLGGDSTVADYVIMGGLSALHQQCRIGKYAFIGGGAPVTGDVIPYGMVDNLGALAGLNLVGLKRRGFARDAIHDLRAAYRLVFANEGAFNERIEDAARLFENRPEVMDIVEFIRTPAKRPLCSPEGR
ncbi:acyl-ACP--UDP-N-acetylglucosamine O-acyltransferase [Oceanicaulis sp.]|uniref:acyl-ACP--UDP-N-acetylglucosamine O-acyltransferase n=1 Tax=Oceanicaulis sp. TaxID=1924941 RepID=UPI003F6E801E